MRSPVTYVEKPGYTLSVSSVGRTERPQAARLEVCLSNGRRWRARLHTPESVRAILDEWRRRGKRRGEHSGLYFWAPGVIVVREITREGVVALVEDLMAEGELELALVPVEEGGGAT